MEDLWGLSRETITELSMELSTFHQEFAELFRTKTRDMSEHGLTGLKGSLLMEGKRTYTNVARKVVDALDDGQNFQHFMSDSPWQAAPIFTRIQGQIGARAELAGGMLNIDESGEECSSPRKAGAQKQYLGRLGKVELGQVGVVASYYHAGVWAVVDAELFLPESWFSAEKKMEWTRLHIPADREFLTKLEIAQAQIDRACAQALPFAVVGADTWYGQDPGFRDHIACTGKQYLVSIPCDTRVYLEEPQVGVPAKRPGQRGPHCRNEQVLSDVPTVAVRDIARHVAFESVTVRDCERGLLVYDHAFLEVWTVREETRHDEQGKAYTGLRVVKELLVIRKDTPTKTTYSLSNAPLTTEKRTLAQWKANRYFVERSIQDTKTEAGWDDLASPKYRAYLHTLAIDALALWFVARIKLHHRRQQAAPDTIRKRLGVDRLPDISFANIRELLLTVLPLKRLSPEDALEVVTRHLVGRTKATRSRLKGTVLRI